MVDKVCFVVCPIGDKGSETRNNSDWVLHYISPLLERSGYSPVRADKMDDPGLISEQIIEMIINADLVIADMTGHNPNVFYELAIRHTTGKPVILVIKKGEKIPFDVQDNRSIEYNFDNPQSMSEFISTLSGVIDAVNKEEHFSSNVYLRVCGVPKDRRGPSVTKRTVVID